MNIDIENRIYVLRNSNLPGELSRKITEADVHYLQDNNSKAMELILFVEEELKNRGLSLYIPEIEMSFLNTNVGNSKGNRISNSHTGKLYRFELDYCGEPQGVGFIKGLVDVGIPEAQIDILLSDFNKSLLIPNFKEFVYDRGREYPASYFTEEGKSLFYPAIKRIIDYIAQTNDDFELKEEVIEAGNYLYLDEYQAIMLKQLN